MWPKPVLFISAVSKELHSARAVVAKTLLSLGYDSDWEDVFDLEHGDIKAILRRRIDAADGVIQIIGQCHGCELPQPDPDFGRVSYTQYEALYARQRGKKVWYLLLDDTFPTDPHDSEPEDLRQLQGAYRQRVLDDTHLYHRAKDHTELENRIHKLNPEFAQLRRRSKQVTALAVGLLLVLLAGGAWLKYAQGRDSAGIAEIKDQNNRLLLAMRELPTTLAQASQAGDKESEPARLARAYVTLEDKLKLPRGTLEKDLPQFAEQLLLRADTSLMDRASSLFAVKKFAEAEFAALEAKDKALAAAGQPVKDVIVALELAGIAAWEQIQYARAMDHYRAAAALTSQQHAPLEWAFMQRMIAGVLYDQGDYLQAAEVLRPVIETCERVLGLESRLTLESRSSLVSALGSQGNYSDAEKEGRYILTVHQSVLGPEHPDTLSSRNNLANALSAQGKYAEAEKEFRAVLAIRERVLGPEHHDTLSSRSNLAAARYGQGKCAEAEAEFRAVLVLQERMLGPRHRDTLTSRQNLASTLFAQGRRIEAEAEHRIVLAIREQILGPEHPDVFHSCYNLAQCLRALVQKPEALVLARRALAGRQKTLGEGHPDTQAAKKLVEHLEQPQ